MTKLFFGKAGKMNMRVLFCLLVAVSAVQLVPSSSSSSSYSVPPVAEALKLRPLPVFRRYQNASFFRRRYRQLDVQEEVARKRTTTPIGTPFFLTKRRSSKSRSKDQVLPSATLETGLPAVGAGLPTMMIPPPSDSDGPPQEQFNTVVPVTKASTEMAPEPATSTPTTTPATATTSDPITDVHELRRRVLDQGTELRKVPVALEVSNMTVDELLNHQVIQLMVERFHSKSTPGNRDATDTARLALSMEGGGMRGAVSAGMAAAIASLGLCDTFDAVYGSSAGSIIGAYFVSRQMCMDVYVDILPAAKILFVCKKRLVSSLAVTAVDWVLSRLWLWNDDVNLPKLAHKSAPGMNISFVLDGIMDETHGVRPLNLKNFRENDQKQPLRVASSYVKNHKLYTKSFGTQDFFPVSDKFDDNVKSTETTPLVQKGQRQGLFACLQASMTVPGAAGPPVRMKNGNETLPFFDAFCFEPLPYRSAVEEGATHCLVLCSRPEGFQPKTKPGVYEKAVAPMYFQSHGEPTVASFFEKGGQQYIYAEDLLTLEEGKRAGIVGANADGGQAEGTRSSGGVLVPPPTILYGVERDAETEKVASQRDDWKRAHLLPLKVPVGTPELGSLEQGRDEVLEAVRGGYAAAFDLLAPAIGLELVADLTGSQVAKLVFPDAHNNGGSVLEHQLHVDGDFIGMDAIDETPDRRRKRDAVGRVFKFVTGRKQTDLLPPPLFHRTLSTAAEDSEVLLSMLPGFQAGKMSHLAGGLRSARTMLP